MLNLLDLRIEIYCIMQSVKVTLFKERRYLYYSS